MALSLHAQGIVRGTVTDGNRGIPLSGVHIVTGDSQGTVTDDQGRFSLTLPEGKRQVIRISHIGYFPEEISIQPGQADRELNITLIPSPVNPGTVIVTATRTLQRLKDVPGQVELISSKQMESTPMHSIDNALRQVTGINISRERGILDHRTTVSMRGLGGDQQGRSLVLLDGMPLNKADGGSVNWNMINTADIRQIEMAKGPSSSLYGGHAMGGVINLISRKPQKKLEGYGAVEAGTFNTRMARLSLSGTTAKPDRGFYWGVNAFGNRSDGYINVPEEERDSTVIATPLREWGTGARLGYRIAADHYIEWNGSYWYDKRGSGSLILDPGGTFFGHSVWSQSIRYSGKTANTGWEWQAYSQKEDYIRLTESVRLSGNNPVYTSYDVTSDRDDQGILSRYYHRLGRNTITLGAEMKWGSVNGRDVYSTSTDIVTNQGKTRNLALYLQDEYDLIPDRLAIIGGVRYDHVTFYEGKFFITDPTSATSILKQLENLELGENTWKEFSPKLALRLHILNNWTVYTSYGHGFRPSVLDDLCRSGFIRGGFKRANPLLGPENIDNFEAGSQLHLWNRMTLNGALFYTHGEEFIYLIGTGDSVLQGSRKRPVMEARNITGVRILGAELSMKVNLMAGFDGWVNYALHHSTITDTRSTPELEALVGKQLMYVPRHKVAAGFIWINQWVNATLQATYTGEQWMDDANTLTIPGFFTLDARIWKDWRGFTIFVNGQNLTNEVHLDGHGQLSMGRFVTGGLSFRF